MPSRLRLGVTGARGFIGSKLAQAALDAGHEVHTFCRASWTGVPFVPRAHRHQLTLPDAPDPRDLEGLDALIHLAVAPHGSSEETAFAVNVTGTARLQEAAATAGVERFIFVSTQSAHDGARNRYGRSKRAAERALEGRQGVMILRPGLVYDGSENGLLGRSAKAAAKLGVFPVVGGDRAMVQTLWLDDLVTVLLRFADPRQEPNPPALLELAEPIVHPLGDVVADAAHARCGRRPRVIGIPLEAVQRVARFARLSPVGEAVSEVVDGIAAFRPMETAPALAELGISLRPFDPSVFRPGHSDAVTHGPDRPRGSARTQPPEGQEDGYRLALVGSGRIGTAHAVSALHHPDAYLCALVDPSKAAISRLRSVLGRPVAHYSSIDELLASPDRPDAAIVATPPGTHAELATRLLDERVRVLVEKPLAPKTSRVSLLQAGARAARSGIASATGYHMRYLPHLEEARIRFLAGEFGAPQRFCTLGFVTRAESGRGLSWELNPSLAGGGALSHIPAHSLSILDRFLGPLEAIESTLVYARNQTVDDAGWVHLGNGNVDGSLFTCWHLPGFIAPETSVRIETNSGLLILTPASSAFFAHDGSAPVILTALDAQVRGFDPAPLDAGFGFWREQRSLLDQEEIRTSFPVADRIEQTVDQAYAKATAKHFPPPSIDIDPRMRTVSAQDAVSAPTRRLRHVHSDSGGDAPGPLVLVDVRNLVIESVDLGEGERYVVNPGQLRSLRSSPPLVVTPNVPKIFRTATNDGFAALVRSFGTPNLATAAVRIQPHRLLAEAERFWEVFNTLLLADIGHLPRHYPGRVALDGYLVDLAASLGRFDELVRLFRTLRRRLPKAELGLESNAPDLLCRVLPVISSHVSFVVGVGSPQLALADRVRRVADRPDLGVIIKCGQQPPEVTQFAVTHAGLWATDAEALVIDGRAAPEFSALNAANLRRALVSTGCPDWAAADACELLGI